MSDIEDVLKIISMLILFLIISPFLLTFLEVVSSNPSCVETGLVNCTECTSECNISQTHDVEEGPFYDRTTKTIEVCKREVCVRWDNETGGD